tara:strand:+ start:38566 stop:38736 length:171 start_codon:yes stop_codon:yes gene_type:complete
MFLANSENKLRQVQEIHVERDKKKGENRDGFLPFSESNVILKKAINFRVYELRFKS